jgi:transcriptional regulator with XRE-family HTH domain
VSCIIKVSIQSTVGVTLLDLIQIGKKLTELRQMKAYSQDELAELLFLSHQAISKWERGATLPSIDNMCSLMELYAVSLEELLCLNSITEGSDLDKLLQEHNHQYLIHEVVYNKIEGVHLPDIIHKLSREERFFALYLLIDHGQEISETLWPRLSLEERQMIIHKYNEGKVKLNQMVINKMMTSNEIKKTKEI